MGWRSNAVLFAIAVLLSVYAYIFEVTPAPWEKMGHVFPNLRADDIVELYIERPALAKEGQAGDTRPIRMRWEKRGNDTQWWIVEPIDFRAYQPRVRVGIVGAIVDLLRISEVPGLQRDENGAVLEGTDLTPYLGEAPEVRVRFWDQNRAETTIEVGREHPALEKFCYVSVNGDVFVARKMVKDTLWMPLKDLRSRGLVQVAFADATKISVAGAEGAEKVLVREPGTDGRWALRSPFNAQADRVIVKEFMDSLNSWTVVDFVNDNADAGALKDYGLDKPRAAVTVEGKNGLTFAVEIGRSFKSGDSHLVYARHADSPFVFSAAREPLEYILEPAESFRSTYVFDLGLEEIVGLDAEILRGVRQGTKLQIRREKKKADAPANAANQDAPETVEWRVTEVGRAEDFPGDRERIGSTIASLRQLRIERFVEPLAMAASGLQPTPWARLTLRMEGGKNHVLHIGAASKDPNDAGLSMYHVARAGEPGAFMAVTLLPEFLVQGVYGFRDRAISSIEPVELLEIEVSKGDRKWTLGRANNQWSLPVTARYKPERELDSTKVNAVVAALQTRAFRVFRYLPEQQEGFEKLGLDRWKPRYGLRVLKWIKGADVSGFRRLLVGIPVEGVAPPVVFARTDIPGLPAFQLAGDLPRLLDELTAHLEEILE